MSKNFSKGLADNPAVVTVCAKDLPRLRAIYENVERLTEREVANLNRYFLLQTDCKEFLDNIDNTADQHHSEVEQILHHGRLYKLSCPISYSYLFNNPNEIIYLSMRIHYKSSTWAAVVVQLPTKQRSCLFLEPAAPESERIER